VPGGDQIVAALHVGVDERDEPGNAARPAVRAVSAGVTGADGRSLARRRSAPGAARIVHEHGAEPGRAESGQHVASGHDDGEVDRHGGRRGGRRRHRVDRTDVEQAIGQCGVAGRQIVAGLERAGDAHAGRAETEQHERRSGDDHRAASWAAPWAASWAGSWATCGTAARSAVRRVEGEPSGCAHSHHSSTAETRSIVSRVSTDRP
jgi:hypothetical protein